MLGSYNQALKYAKYYLSIAKELGDKEQEGRAYRYLGSAFHRLGDYYQGGGRWADTDVDPNLLRTTDLLSLSTDNHVIMPQVSPNPLPLRRKIMVGSSCHG